MSIAALTQRLRGAPVPPVPSAKTPEGTENRLTNQRGSPGSPGSPEKTIRVEVAGEEPRRLWLVTLPNGERFSLSCTPPATRTDLRGRYPGALVEPEPELEPEGGALDPLSAAIVGAWLDAIGETDPTVRAEILNRAAAEPEALALYLRLALAAGVATDAPPPDAPTDPAPGASCGRCRHFQPDPINPPGGLGRCLSDAPASRAPGSCWPRGAIRCGAYEAAPAR